MRHGYTGGECTTEVVVFSWHNASVIRYAEV